MTEIDIVGEHVIGEIGGGLRHAASGARWAKAAAFAGESDEAPLFAGGALHSGEAAAQQTAAEVGFDFAIDEAGQGSAFGFAGGVERLSVVADDFVEQGRVKLFVSEPQLISRFDTISKSLSCRFSLVARFS